MLAHNDVIIHSDDSIVNNHVSLTKLTGMHIVDIIGTIAGPREDYAFKAWRIVLANGQTLELEGEHDAVYVFNTYQVKIIPGYDELKNIYKTNPENDL